MSDIVEVPTVVLRTWREMCRKYTLYNDSIRRMTDDVWVISASISFRGDRLSFDVAYSATELELAEAPMALMSVKLAQLDMQITEKRKEKSND